MSGRSVMPFASPHKLKPDRKPRPEFLFLGGRGSGVPRIRQGLRPGGPRVDGPEVPRRPTVGARPGPDRLLRGRTPALHRLPSTS